MQLTELCWFIVFSCYFPITEVKVICTVDKSS